MDSIEIGENSNQTLFEFYENYLQECKQILGIYFRKYQDELFDYLQKNAQHLAIGMTIYILFSICFYCFIIQTKLVRHVGNINNCKNILFVISHPDDECMFFGPTIVTLSNKPDCNVYLLCLSRGKVILNKTIPN